MLERLLLTSDVYVLWLYEVFKIHFMPGEILFPAHLSRRE